jgi:hypothetical protein
LLAPAVTGATPRRPIRDATKTKINNWKWKPLTNDSRHSDSAGALAIAEPR